MPTDIVEGYNAKNSVLGHWVELRIEILSSICEVGKLLILILLEEVCFRIDLDLSLEATGWYPKNYFSIVSGWKILLWSFANFGG